MNILTHFMLQSNLPNKQITAVSCCLVSLWKDNYIPLVKGSYYLRQLEPNKKLLAVGKLIDTVTDTTVTFQHFQSEPFTNKLIFRPWMDEETVTTESFVSHLNLPDILDPGRKVVFQEGDLPGSNLK